jgi:hypothetical protein
LATEEVVKLGGRATLFGTLTEKVGAIGARNLWIPKEPVLKNVKRKAMIVNVLKGAGA